MQIIVCEWTSLSLYETGTERRAKLFVLKVDPFIIWLF